MSHNKNIETSREARLWVCAAVSATTVATMLATNPYLQDKVYEGKVKIKRMTNNVKRKIRDFKETHSKKITIEKKSST